jgi:hypothetical protein
MQSGRNLPIFGGTRSLSLIAPYLNSLTVMMEAVYSSKTSVNFHKIKRCHVTEDSSPQILLVCVPIQITTIIVYTVTPYESACNNNSFHSILS